MGNIGDQNQVDVLENLRNQLALTVRSIQWSYAIFWSNSSTKPGALEWGDGYYNGDIKTRKTVQAAELSTDHLGLQRSDQLRELYESLSLGESSPQAKRPTAALSPEDLTDAEWYFLVCMSFVFNIEQGLPGKTLAKNKPTWLCNAHLTDTKSFSRSLLAKSASIQTIVCFPHLGGVIELGATEHVPEDLNLIEHIKRSFLESPSTTTVPRNPDYVHNNFKNSSYNNISEDGLDHLLDCPDMAIASPNDSSNEFADNLLRDESNLVDGEASQIQSFPFMDDVISNCLNNSATNSSDCVSQTQGDHETVRVPLWDMKESDNNGLSHEPLENNNNKNDIHYQSVLSNLLRGSQHLILGPHFRKGSGRSSFAGWRKDGLSGGPPGPRSGPPQRLLKKVLFEVAKMHEMRQAEASKRCDVGPRPEVEEVDRNHVLSERKRREKINERFSILGSLIPSGGKVDKVSILDHTIQYLRDLERKVEELESYKEAMESDATARTKHHDAMERTSDNYGPDQNGNSKKPLTNKRKACEIGKTGAENNRSRLKDSLADNITVSVIDKDVLIEIKCPWKDSAVVEIMEAVTKLRMDTQSVQSSNTDGVLSITIKAKCKGLRAPSPAVIRQALQKVIKKC